MIENDKLQPILSVAELNFQARDLLENHFPQVWVSGEISNLACPSSGHVYFSLKDEQAQVRAALFRQQHRQLPFKLENGLQILVQAKLSLYPARGDYQLIVSQAELAGAGLLQRQFEQLKIKLQQQGLFALERKRALPEFPRTIGIITSPTAAALRDVLSVLRRRAPMLNIIIYPTSVQGDKAPAEIVRSIQQANRHATCEVLILCRGGGSIEDLWAFNDEKVAQAIFNSQLPIVSGVGHEIDFTISDFVADVRAPTPSAAAELVSPKREDMLTQLHLQLRQLHNFIEDKIQDYHFNLLQLSQRLRHPKQLLQDYQQRLDYLERALNNALTHQQHKTRVQFTHLITRFKQTTPQKFLVNKKLQLQFLQKQLLQIIRHQLQQTQDHFNSLMKQLQLVSPLATLDRGYAIVRSANREVIKSAHALNNGDEITILLADGEVDSKVIKE
ncbi:MAG: exodeoxyribonuclease VII large subunit [Legionellales bacterium]|nr:exodeoxyribonuclease VII large subunit [Legionellales bacterium]